MLQPKNNFKVVTEKKNARVILPNMLTLIGVCIGLTSIRFALDEKFEFAIVAIILAAVNIFGGFLVTQRMLAMYKKKRKTKD